MAANEGEGKIKQQHDEKTAILRESIRHVFPAEPYTGKITENDENLDDPDLDEDRDLYEALKGRRWTELPNDLLNHLPDGYVSLTDEAFPAFLPAWLMASLDNMESESEIRNFMVYSFSATMRKFRVLNPEQQRTVRTILVEYTERGTDKYVQKYAVEAIALIDRNRY